MRTTLTVDDDLMDLARQESAASRRPLRDVLNDRLRLGFSAQPARKSGSKFKVEPFKTRGFAPGIDERKLNQLLDELETAERKT
jgi:hypothetical protein